MFNRNAVQDILQTITNRSNQDTLKGFLVRGAFNSFAIKILNTLLIFSYSFVLARVLGVEGYGLYEYVIAWVMLLVVPSMFGMDRLLLRMIPASITLENWGRVRGLLRWSTGLVLVSSAIIAVVAALVAFYNTPDQRLGTLFAFWIGCAVLPVTALTMMWEGTLRGLRKVIYGQLPIMIMRPALIIAVVGVLFVFELAPLNPFTVLYIFVGASLLSMAASAWFLARNIPQEAKTVAPEYDWRPWMATAFPMMLMGGLNIANNRVGIIFLGTLQSPESAGVYSVLVKGADLITFTLIAVNVVLAPTFANLFAAQDMKRLQKVVTQSARLIFLTALPIGLGLYFFGYWFLLIFGDGFTGGLGPLRIIVIGQVINVAMGSVGVLLNMTGHERDALLGYAIGVTANVIFCWLLIPSMDVVGAAWALFISNMLWNISLAILVYWRLGIHATVLGSFRFLSNR